MNFAMKVTMFCMLACFGRAFEDEPEEGMLMDMEGSGEDGPPACVAECVMPCFAALMATETPGLPEFKAACECISACDTSTCDAPSLEEIDVALTDLTCSDIANPTPKGPICTDDKTLVATASYTAPGATEASNCGTTNAACLLMDCNELPLATLQGFFGTTDCCVIVDNGTSEPTSAPTSAPSVTPVADDDDDDEASGVDRSTPTAAAVLAVIAMVFAQ